MSLMCGSDDDGGGGGSDVGVVGGGIYSVGSLTVQGKEGEDSC